MNKFSELKDREGGFTLIELLVVIIIIGILAAIAIPLFLDQRKLAVDASVKSDVRNTTTNITTAQAVASANNASTSTFKAAITSGNTVELNGTALTAGTDATGPAAGADFTVNGYNAGGKNFTGKTAGKSYYQFSSATGQFSTVAGA